ncbi:hypothetical protein [Streptomyces sp. NPDC008141]|uniref:hypothetical protein n=1 Tax=Streptomyces sp. NPDC008141 TaxID=3364815 RepID=UPI0036E02844
MEDWGVARCVQQALLGDLPAQDDMIYVQLGQQEGQGALKKIECCALTTNSELSRLDAIRLCVK